MKIIKIIILLVILNSCLALADIYYSVGMTYNMSSQTFSLNDINLVATGPDNLIQHEGYTAKIYAFNSSQTYSLNFSTTVYDAVIKKVPLKLSFPYQSYAKSMNIYNKNGRLVFAIDLSKYATCNQNGFCDVNENKNNCKQDCDKEEFMRLIKLANEEKVSKTNVTVPKTREEISQKSKVLPFVLVIIIILIIVAFVLFWVKRRQL